MLRKNKSLLFLLLMISIVVFVFINNLPLSKEVISAEFVLGENMGFDLSPGKLNFGKIIPGNSASREIVVENNFDKTVKISIKSSGEISKNLIVSDNNFILNPSESRNVTFSLYTNDLTESRYYKGEIIIVSKKA